MSGVRVRFAPSPTGYLHLGGARTAIFNWLFAKKNNGVLVLRIEDTDVQRSSQEMVQGIIEGLHFLKIEPDEGPYFQSSFIDQHTAAAKRLVETGKAYYDFTPKEESGDRVATDRSGAGRDKPLNPYRDLPIDEAIARVQSGETAAIRLKVAESGLSRFTDMVYGPQEREFRDIEDLVLVRSDGNPLYNLSVVVDDIQMKITDVIRGQDHLTNTHKQILVYEALGSPPPRFAHLPLIFAPGREKLSKRKHGEVVSITTYRERGFIPDALVNFLALLGWSPGGDQEIMSREDLIEKFSLDAVNKSSAVFNFSEGNSHDWTDPKALWMNGEYIKSMPLDQLLPLVAAHLKKAGLWRSEYESDGRQWFARTVDLLRARYRTLSDFASLGRPYFSDDFEMDPAAVKKNLAKDGLRTLLTGFCDRVAHLEDFTHDSIEAVLREYAEENGVKAGLLINAARTALTGQAVGPGMFDIFVTVGREKTVARLRAAVELAA